MPKKDPLKLDKKPKIGSLSRMLGILDLFSPQSPIWTAEDIINHMEQSRSTCYRYLRALQRSGLIAPVENGHFILGPRILTLDKQIRECDPLYNAAGDVMARLSAATGHATLLCGLYSDSVMCIRCNHVEGAPKTIHTRGHKWTLFRGSLAKIILAHLQAHQLKRLYQDNRHEIAVSGLGAAWPNFQKTLQKMRRNGYCRTSGEAFAGVTGIAAPIFNRRGSVLGSIGVVMSDAIYRPEDSEFLAQSVIAAGEEVTAAVRNFHRQEDLAARAISGEQGR